MFFIYPTPQYPRKALEYVFKSLYMIANLAHLTSLVVLISDFYTRLSNSMPFYYTKSELVISDSILLVMHNCVYSGSIKLGNVRGTVEVTAGNIGYGLMTTAQYVTGLFVLEFLLIVNNLFVALNYSKGNRHLRIFGVHFPVYHLSVAATQCLSCTIVVLMWAFDGNRQFFQRALQYCAAQLETTNKTLLLASEFDDNTIFSTAVYWPFAATCVAEIIYISAMVVLCYFSSDEATILLSEADAPWESRGLMCTTSKPLLKLHTAQRNAIIEDARNAIKEGQKVRIVRSYQLITEEDFTALVQAMREQVARALKEKQFEQLKRTFGDNESQLDNMGFAWRENLMAAPPAGEEGGGVEAAPPADQFFNVPFEDYFTDNEGNGDARDRFGDDGGVMGRGGPDEVYRDEPLSIQEGGFGDDGVNGFYGDGSNGLAFDPLYDGTAGQDVWSPQEGAYMMDGVGEMYDPPELQQHPRRVSHTHHRRRHRRPRHGDGGDEEAEAEEDYMVEPDPRMPRASAGGGGFSARGHFDAGDAFTSPSNYFDANDDAMYGTSDVGGVSGGLGYAPATGRGSRYDGTSNSNYPASNRGSRQRQQQQQPLQRRQSRGRQAGIEHEDEVADELSDGFGY